MLHSATVASVVILVVHHVLPNPIDALPVPMEPDYLTPNVSACSLCPVPSKWTFLMQHSLKILKVNSSPQLSPVNVV